MADSNGKRMAESQAPKAKTVQTDENKGDMLSELPDDILICVLSRLTVEEATVTSILSTRWRHLCTYITHLHFQPLKLRSPIIGSTPPKEENNFNVSSTVWHPPRFLDMCQKQFSTSTSVDWINHVLDCYNGGVLKEFRLNMPHATQLDVEKWLVFALSREVETLYIHLDTDTELLKSLGKFFLKSIRVGCIRARLNYFLELMTERYSYPVRNLILKDKGNGCGRFTSLKTLYLHNVDLHVLEVELMLSNCVVLETLSITHSLFLGNVIKIGGPSLKLKHLEIIHCCPTIQIHDLINLVSFSFAYFRPPMEWIVNQKFTPIVMENVPSVTDIEWIHNSDVILMSTGLSCCLHQLVKLTLGLIKPLSMQNCLWHRSLPKLMNLKYLVFILDMVLESRILKLTTLIDECPILEKLDVQFSWWSPKVLKDADPIDEELWEHPHNNLKQVRFCNYLGSPYELEFGLSIFKNAVNLEEFVVEPCATINDPSRKDDEMSIRRKASAFAHQQFQATVPKSVKLVIL